MNRIVFIVIALGSSLFVHPIGITAQWVQVAGISNNVIVEAFTSYGPFLIMGGSAAYRSRDNGDTWEVIDSGLVFPNEIVSFASNQSRLFAGTQTGVYVTTDSGASWSYSSTGLTSWLSPNSGRMSRYIPSLLVYGSRILAGSDGGGIYCSTDNGSSWCTSSKGLSGWTSTLVVAFTVVGSRVLAGTYGGVYVSSDSGSSWTPILILATCFATSDKYLFGGESGGDGVFRSSDGGANWARCDSGLTATDVLCLASNGTSLFAGTGSGGVFLSTNGGNNWTAVNSGLAEAGYRALDVDALIIRENYLVAATHFGIWRRPLSEFVTSIQSDKDPTPEAFELSQNYPNPFNPSTTIRYALPTRTHVTLSVFNTLGQLVSTLVNREEEPGYHDVRFDGSNLASGVYFYRLQAGEYIATKRLLLLR